MSALGTSLQTVLENLDWPVEAATDLTRVARIVTFEKSATIFRAGESADLLYLLLSGEASESDRHRHCGVGPAARSPRSGATELRRQCGAGVTRLSHEL